MNNKFFKHPYKIVLGSMFLCLLIGIFLWTQNSPEPHKSVTSDQTPAPVAVVPETETLPLSPNPSDTVRATDTTASQAETDTPSLSQLEKELGHLSVSELIPILEQMDLAVVRDLGENAEWLREKFEAEEDLLSTEENIALETLERKAYGGELERMYEAETGFPMPPPGYREVVDNLTGERRHIKINSPNIYISRQENEAYGQMDNLTQEEFTRFHILQSISHQSELFEMWEVSVSDAVAARAKELKDELFKKTYGTHITYSVGNTGYWTRPKTEADIALADKLIKEAHAKLDAQTGQSTRSSTKHDRTAHRDDYIKILREIEAELAQQ